MIQRLLVFRRDGQGAALVELAFVLPLLVVMYLGSYEIVGIVRAYMKLANATETLAELVAAKLDPSDDSTIQPNVTAADIMNFCSGAKLVLTPLPSTGFKAAIASVTASTNKGTVTVAQDWQDTTNCGNAAPISNTTTIANGVLTSSGDSVIIVQATYTYTSPIRYVLPANHDNANRVQPATSEYENYPL